MQFSYIKDRFCAALFLLSALFVLVALLSYHAQDRSWYFMAVAADGSVLPVANWCGAWGARVASLLLYIWGGAAWWCVPMLSLCGLALLGIARALRFKLAALLVLQSVMAVLFYKYRVDFFSGMVPGGYVGQVLHALLRRLDADLMMFALFALTWVALVVLVGFSFAKPLMTQFDKLLRIIGQLEIMQKARAGLMKLKSLILRVIEGSAIAWLVPRTVFAHKLEAVAQASDDVEGAVQEVYDALFWQQYTQGAGALAPAQDAGAAIAVPAVTIGQAASVPTVSVSAPYKKPDLKAFKGRVKEVADRTQANSQATLMQEKLSRFGIRGTVVKISSGPVVTLFEYQPEIDMPISKIIAREDDLALALQAMSLRIIAPIPGKSVIGFEVSNAVRQTVYFSEIVTSAVFTKTTQRLPLIIGHDTVGASIVLDLVTMPHLMVAGSTGSGKSVALNGMLVSLLCAVTPDEVRLILIDPKRLEFAAYADIPHLLFPIVTEAKRAVAVLAYAVRVMEERYACMAASGVRNIYDYQEACKKNSALAPMPFMVIVIDELADLMMVTGKEVEGLIARLAQMARAAGIHLIIATQRPSVDVITGVIKVNFPVRIACKVTSKVDSRTILDQGGAEKLLGKGDMLLLDSQGRLQRLHGAYVTDEEIRRVVEHVKGQRRVVYEELSESTSAADDLGEDAQLYQDVLAFVKTVDELSISLIQRRFRIGYNRAARMIDLLEAQGVVMPASGAKNRKVLR